MPYRLALSSLRALIAAGAVAGAASAGADPALASRAAPAGDKLAEARELASAGQTDQALQLLHGILDANEGDVSAARLLLARLQRQADVPERAIETLDPLTDSREYEVLLELGRSYRAAGEKFAADGRNGDDIRFAYDEGRSYLDLAAQHAPAGDATATLEAGYLELYTLGDHAAAQARADALLAANQDDAEARLLRGCAGVYAVEAAQSAGDEAAAGSLNATAVADLLAADKALPKDRPEPWVQLAWLYETADQPPQAVDAAATVLDRVPGADFTTLFHLAQRYAAERRFDPAGRALGEMARRDAAQLTRWIRGATDKDALARDLGYAVEPLVNARRAADAQKILAAIVAADPADADLWNNYGLMCRDSRSYEEAWRAYSRALELSPDEPGLLNDGAVILHYYLHRDYSMASEMYERAVERAQELLAAADLEPARKVELEKSLREATENLVRLARGDYEWAG